MRYGILGLLLAHAVRVWSLGLSTDAGTITSVEARDVAAPTRSCYMTETCIALASGTPTRAPVACPTTGSLRLDCPALNGTTQTVFLGQDSWDFKVACGMDYNGVTDIIAIVSYSFEHCMKACASYNHNRKADQCVALHFETNLDLSVPVNYGNCWLKMSTGTANQGKSNGNAGARLVSSSWSG